MKKKIIALGMACVMLAAFSACGKEDKPVKIVSDEEQIHLAVGDEISVTAETKKSEPIKWSCEDDDIAAITNDGRLAGVANGVTVITAKTESGYDHIGLVVGNGVKGSEAAIRTVDEDGNVTITKKKSYNKDSKITDLQISLNGMTEDETMLLGRDDEGYLKVKVTPSDCDDPLDYTSSDTAVVEVDADGVVYPKAKGTAIITVTAPNGVEDTFKIFVR